MIRTKELRIGNLLTWNPALISPGNTLPPMPVEVYGILPDRIAYVYPNIENRVEPFEDDVAQLGEGLKRVEELEPIELTEEILTNVGFTKKSGIFSSSHFEKNQLQLKHNGEHFQQLNITVAAPDSPSPIQYFHQLQNLYFALTGEELENKLHGQQV